MSDMDQGTTQAPEQRSSHPGTELASPLPWEVVAATDHHGAYIVSASGLDVCDLYAMSNPLAASFRNGGDSYPVPFTDMDANARLIVRAVNSHDALIRALETSDSFIREIANEYTMESPEQRRVSLVLARIIRANEAALEAARGHQ